MAQRARMVTRIPAPLHVAETVLDAMSSVSVGLLRAYAHLLRLPGRSFALDDVVAHVCVLG